MWQQYERPVRWFKWFGISLKDAKQLVITRNGRIPRPGYEMYVYSRFHKVSGFGAYQEEKVYIQNVAGKLILTNYFPHDIIYPHYFNKQKG